MADNGVLLTFSALVPPYIQPSASRLYQRETCCELALVFFALMRRAQRDSPDALALTTCDCRRSLVYHSSFPTLAALHRAAGFGREGHRAGSAQAAPTPGTARLSGAGAAVGEQPASDPWDAPALGELPKTRLATRRCY